MTTTRATHLRHEARHLTAMARHIEHALDLLRRLPADTTTWQGPRASLCVVTLQRHRLHLADAAGELRREAHTMRREAERLDEIELLAS